MPDTPSDDTVPAGVYHEDIGELEAEVNKLEDAIERQKAVIRNLADTLATSLALTDRLMDEILHLHKHANEQLPLELIAAKDELDNSIRKLLEDYRGN